MDACRLEIGRQAAQIIAERLKDPEAEIETRVDADPQDQLWRYPETTMNAPLKRLDNRTARAVFLDRHALAEQPAGAAKGAGLLDLVQRLGFVQLDSINTVARAHDMILFSRRPAYRSTNLKRLYEREKALFEHWTHDAAVIPMSFYPHWHLRFQRDADLLKARWKNWRRDGFEQQFETVLQHIRDHGPVCSSDVGKDEKKGSGGWWDWHPSKTALEFLWRSGALTVVGRDGFRNVMI